MPKTIALGLVIGAIGFLVLTQAGRVDGPGLLVTGWVLACFGIALPMSLLTVLMLGATAPEKAGAAAATNETSGELGIAVGIATLGTLAAVVYRTELTGSLPDTIPVAAGRSALEGITGAADAASALSSALSAELLVLARAAFAEGLGVAAGLGAAVFLALAATTALMLRSPSPSPSPLPVETQLIGEDK
jgi:DHA2 family multidrug resistance protein-like MFS transporter